MKYRNLNILTLLALLLVSIVPLAAQDTAECEDGFRLFDLSCWMRGAWSSAAVTKTSSTMMGCMPVW